MMQPSWDQEAERRAIQQADIKVDAWLCQQDSLENRIEAQMRRNEQRITENNEILKGMEMNGNAYEYSGSTNPYAEAMSGGEALIGHLDNAARELASAFEHENEARRAAEDAMDTYQMAEDEMMFEYIMQAQAKEGPLGGVAVTSSAYKTISNKLLNSLRCNGLQYEWEEAQRLQRAYEDAKIARMQAETQFTKLRKAADITAGILRCGARV